MVLSGLYGLTRNEILKSIYVDNNKIQSCFNDNLNEYVWCLPRASRSYILVRDM